MESNTETVPDLEQSEPWIMLEDSGIEVCEEPLKTKEVEVPNNEELKQSEASQNNEEDDFSKLRNHRKFIEQLETIEDLTWDPTDITSDKSKLVEETTESKALCTKCSLCSVLLNKGGSKLASYLCNTFLALCVLALASGLAYYFQSDQFMTSNMKNILVRYNQPEHAMRYDKYKYIEPKYEKNKNQGNYDINKYEKYEDTTRKQEKKVRKEKQHHEHEQSGQNDYKKRKDRKEIKEKKEYKNEFNEKRYNKKKLDKVYKQEYRELNQKKNYKSMGDYKKK